MFIENGATKIVAYCAQVVRIIARNDARAINIWNPVLDEINARLPSGSGFNSGSEFLPCESRPDRLVFKTAFHHMDENGYYDGWTQHSVIVTPTFEGFNIRVTGKNKNDIKDFIADCFHAVLDDIVKTSFDIECQELRLVYASYDYGFNGPIAKQA
jgi:hypothetical protein